MSDIKKKVTIYVSIDQHEKVDDIAHKNKRNKVKPNNISDFYDEALKEYFINHKL